MATEGGKACLSIRKHDHVHCQFENTTTLVGELTSRQRGKSDVT